MLPICAVQHRYTSISKTSAQCNPDIVLDFNSYEKLRSLEITPLNRGGIVAQIALLQPATPIRVTALQKRSARIEETEVQRTCR